MFCPNKNKIFVTLLMALYLVGNPVLAEQGNQEVDSLVYSDGDTKVVMGTELTVDEAEVLEELVVVAGEVEVYGQVEELTVLGGRVKLHSTAKVTKELNVIGGEVEQVDGAIIQGQRTTVDIPMDSHQWSFVLEEVLLDRFDRFFSKTSWTFWFFIFLKILSLYLLTRIVMAIAPFFVERSKQQFMSSAFASAGWGLVSVLLFLPIFIMLVLSIFGIALLPLHFTMYFLFLCLGYVVAAMGSAEWLGNKLGFPKGGFIIIGLVGLELLLMVPGVGWFLVSLLSFLGFGAVSAGFYGSILSRLTGNRPA